MASTPPHLSRRADRLDAESCPSGGGDFDARPSESKMRLTTHVNRSEHQIEGNHMSNHTYRLTEIVGTAPESADQAIQNGIARAASTVRNLDWFEVTQIRGQIENGKAVHFQVSMKIGFRVDDE